MSWRRSVPAPEHASTLSLDGLTDTCVVKPQVLGTRGSRMVVDATKVRHVVDPSSNLVLFPLDDVFTTPRLVLGFGVPNAYLAFPSEDPSKWDKYAAFMFFRSPSAVVSTKGRSQSGVMFEIDVPEEVAAKVREIAISRSGKRTITCARESARVLSLAGFTCGGKTFTHTIRPSKLAALVWEHGLEYEGKPVRTRAITTSKSPTDHFVGVWSKEATAPGRAVKKVYTHDTHAPAPVFEPVAILPHSSTPQGELTTLSMSRPSYLGAHMGFAFGTQPMYSARFAAPLTDECLASPLKAYPGVLDTSTKVKRYVLFSRPVIAFLNHHLVFKAERYEGVPAGILPPMLTLSTRERETAYVYNYVVTGDEMRLKRLEGASERERKTIQWLLAKHVLISGYSKDVRLAGEIWSYLRDDGTQVLVVNANSGTYKPTPERLHAAAEVVSNMFGVEVETQEVPS